MADIDFDELDRAVSSLMKDASGNILPSQPSSQNTETESVVVPSLEMPVVNSAPAVSVAQVPAATPTLATKRRGQFMDMKMPSADMKQALKPLASHQAAVVQPVAPVVETLSVEAPLVDSSSQTMDESVVGASVSPSTQLENSSVVEAASSNIDNEIDKMVDDSIQTSPFLPDAKVEKRPLGSTQPTGGVVMSNTSLDGNSVTPIETPDSISEVTDATDIPSDLHDAVMQAEADTTLKSAGSLDSTSKDNPNKSNQNTENSDTSVPTASIESTTAPAGRDSIPAQYMPHQDDTDQQASLYDSHSAPIVTPKKHSHWLVVIVIITLIVLGGVGGAAVYLWQTGAL